MSHSHLTERLRAAILGAALGDALGVPVEFQSRAAVQRNPVTSMRAFGTHDQPAGTWSDDTSMMLCLTQALTETGGAGEWWRRAADLFRAWYDEALWTPHGEVFDIGVTTAGALRRYGSVADPREAGATDQHSNGNGSLMRTMPVALFWHHGSFADLAQAASVASRLTHAHPRSVGACVVYCAMVRALLAGEGKEAAWDRARADGLAWIEQHCPGEDTHFRPRLERSLAQWLALPESHIGSGGYVMHTLEAALWCFLTTGGYAECVLRAVNLGEDTDTTGTVAGGLAGAFYGEGGLPADWLAVLARRAEIESLIEDFADKILRGPVA
ncbi:MAG: ADP-ribosylglycohydrolase family protein [Sumerlaeia bacterium]